MGQLLAPGLENERASRRRGAPVKNHARENVLAIRDAERANRERKEEEAQSKAKLYKMKQFENVPSRLTEPGRREKSRTTARPSSRDKEDWGESPPTSAREGTFLRRGARESKPAPHEVHKERVSKQEPKRFLNDSVRDEKPRTPRREAVPRKDEVLKLKPKNDVCHIAKNRTKASRLEPPKKKADPKSGAGKHDDFGAVPAYLDRRKAELRDEAESRKQAQPDPDCPPGMTKMDDAERKDALRQLKGRRKEIQDDLFKMPLNVTTVRLKMKQDALHKQLDDVEKSIAIFDRDVVYIQA